MNQYLRRKIWTLNRSGKFRGYLRTVSGYPVTLTDCMAGQPVSLAVDGNAVQDGTPTPDNPVDVQLCGDRTVNLFDGGQQPINENNNSPVSAEFINGKYICHKETGTFNQMHIVVPISLKPNIAHTLKINRIKVTTLDGTVSYSNTITGIGILNPDKTYLKISNKINLVSFTTTDYKEYYFLLDVVFNWKPLISAEIDKIQIVEGAYTAETMPAYEPYGYKVSGRVEGMNLLSSAFEQGNIDANTGENTTNNIRIRTIDHIKCKPNTVYTIYSPYPVIGVREYDINKTYTGFCSSTVSSVTHTFTTSKNTEYLRFITQSQDGTVPDMTLPYMLVEGAYTAETMPAYEPYREPQTFNIYTPQQLAKVGDTVDTVVLDFDNKTAKLVNAVGIDDLSAEYLRDILDNVCTFVCTFNKNKILQNSNVGTTNRFVCEYGYYEDVEKAFVAMRDYTPRYVLNIAKTRIGYTEEDTSDTLTQKANDWLSENETYGLYSIANPITTDITALQDWDAMPPLWSGTAEITADTVIAPNAITAKYYAGKPEEVN